MTGLVVAGIFLIMEMFPSSHELHYVRVFAACIIIGLLFHFLEDICTMKGLCLIYPFNETYKISGSIRPYNKEDFRIRQFHILTGVAITVMIMFYYTGLYPEYLKWSLSVGTLVVCIVIMFCNAEVRMEHIPSNGIITAKPWD